ncbi:unnamed protein product [Effrenium voratum]|nr:unnamed protein product [Effrenium voratum]
MDPDLVQTIKPPPSSCSQRSGLSQRSRSASCISTVSGAGRQSLHRVPSLPLGERRPAARTTTTETAGVQLGHLPSVNVPGYTGFVPGKASESVLGATHQRANALALMACSRRGVPEEHNDFARRTNPYGLLMKRRGAGVPGYTGYIPGKHPGNVFGSTFADSNTTAMEVNRELALSREHKAPSATLAAPTSLAGTRPAYVVTRWQMD